VDVHGPTWQVRAAPCQARRPCWLPGGQDVIHASMRTAAGDASTRPCARSGSLVHRHPVQLGFVVGGDPELPRAGAGATATFSGADPSDHLTALGIDLGDQLV
jgi:hypothetical protein